MRRRLLLVLILASGVGLLASIMVYRVVAGVARVNGGEKIVVAARSLDMADTVTKDHVRLVAWPRASIPAGAVRAIPDAEGRVVRTSIVAGEPLLEAKLAPQLAGLGGIMPMLVPPGKRGVTIKVDDAVKETGFILPNSRVDVIVSMQRARDSQDRVAKVILQDVVVLAAGQTVEMRDSKPVSVTTVTLALTPEQAERLALAQREGKLMLATRNLRDNGVVATRGVTPAMLLGEIGVAASPPPRVLSARAAPAQPAASPPTAPASETHNVSVLRGGKVSEQIFTRTADGWRLEHRSDARRALTPAR